MGRLKAFIYLVFASL